MRVDSRRVAVLVGVFLTAVLAFASAILGQTKPRDAKPKGKSRLAVLDFKLMGAVPEKTAGQIIADLLMVRLNDRYEVYERSQLQKLLSEHKLRMTDLVDHDGLAANFGKLKGIRYLVLGSIAKLGDNYIVTARTVDCQTGKVGERAGVECRALNDLPKQVNLLLAKMDLLKASEAAPARRPGERRRAPRRTGPVPFLLRLEPRGAKALIDGKPVKSPDGGLSVRVRLEPGPHVVRASSPGHVPAERVVEVSERPLRGLVRLAKGTKVTDIETRPSARRPAERLSGRIAKETDRWLWLRLHRPGAKQAVTRLVPKALIASRTTRLVPAGRQPSVIFIGQDKPRAGSLWLPFHDRQFCSAIQANVGDRPLQLGAVAKRMKEQFGKVVGRADSLVAWRMPGGDVGVFAKDRNLTILSPNEIWEPKQLETLRTELSAALSALSAVIGGVSDREIKEKAFFDHTLWATRGNLVFRIHVDRRGLSQDWTLRAPECKPARCYAVVEGSRRRRAETCLGLDGASVSSRQALRATSVTAERGRKQRPPEPGNRTASRTGRGRRSKSRGRASSRSSRPAAADSDIISGDVTAKLWYGNLPLSVRTDGGRCALDIVLKEPISERFSVQGADSHVVRYSTNKKIDDLRFP